MDSSIIIVPLNESLWIKARAIGKRRNDSGKGSKGWGKRTTEQEAIGVIGELIACTYFGYKSDFVYGKSDVCDLMFNGKTVDVKTSLMKEGWRIIDLHLLAHKVSHPTELYIRVLISYDRRKGFICGWTTRKYLLDNAEDWKYNNHLLYRLPISELSDISLLKEENPLMLEEWI